MTSPGMATGRFAGGVDDSPSGRSALRRAAEEAVLRGAELTVVHAWSFPGGHVGHGAMSGSLSDVVVEEAQAVRGHLADEVHR